MLKSLHNCKVFLPCVTEGKIQIYFYGATAGIAKINSDSTELNMNGPTHPIFILLQVSALPQPEISLTMFPVKQSVF